MYMYIQVVCYIMFTSNKNINAFIHAHKHTHIYMYIYIYIYTIHLYISVYFADSKSSRCLSYLMEKMQRHGTGGPWRRRLLKLRSLPVSEGTLSKAHQQQKGRRWRVLQKPPEVLLLAMLCRRRWNKPIELNTSGGWRQRLPFEIYSFVKVTTDKQRLTKLNPGGGAVTHTQQKQR